MYYQYNTTVAGKEMIIEYFYDETNSANPLGFYLTDGSNITNLMVENLSFDQWENIVIEATIGHLERVKNLKRFKSTLESITNQPWSAEKALELFNAHNRGTFIEEHPSMDEVYHTLIAIENTMKPLGKKETKAKKEEFARIKKKMHQSIDNIQAMALNLEAERRKSRVPSVARLEK
jgi:hypothetical protein